MSTVLEVRAVADGTHLGSISHSPGQAPAFSSPDIQNLYQGLFRHAAWPTERIISALAAGGWSNGYLTIGATPGIEKGKLPPGPRNWEAHPWTHGWVWHGPTKVGTRVGHSSFGNGKIVGTTKTNIKVEFPDGKVRSFPHAAGVPATKPLPRTPKPASAAAAAERRPAAKTGAAALAAAPAGFDGPLSQSITDVRDLHGLSRDDRVQAIDSIHNYREIRYDGLSRALHSGSDINAYADDIRALDQAMHASKLTSDVVVLRGYRDPARLLPKGQWRKDGNLKGTEWVDPAYASTTVNEKDAVGFAQADAAGKARESRTAQPTLMRIRVPKGTGAIQLSGLGQNGEAELLLGRGLRYRVVTDKGVVGGVRRLDVEVVPA